MSKNLLDRLLVSCASLALAACPGGSGTYMASTPMPPPVSPPPPPPPPAQSPAIFPNITTNTDFATLGLAGSVRDGFSVRFDAASNTYVIGLPSRTPGAFIADPKTETNTNWNGHIEGSPSVADQFSVFKPSASNPAIQLAYTSFGIASGYYSGLLDFVAFGLATPASGIPVSGSATYDALVAGTADSSGRDYPTKTIGGTATLQFDFGAGTLAGHFDPILTANKVNTSLGTYSFVNTMYGVGKTGFSGQLSISGASSLGSFDGQFTGPAAQELMSRWTAPYLDATTKQWSNMFGVWVGKKH